MQPSLQTMPNETGLLLCSYDFTYCTPMPGDVVLEEAPPRGPLRYVAWASVLLATLLLAWGALNNHDRIVSAFSTAPSLRLPPALQPKWHSLQPTHRCVHDRNGLEARRTVKW